MSSLWMMSATCSVLLRAVVAMHVSHGAFTHSQAIQFFDLTRVSLPKRKEPTTASFFQNNISYRGGIHFTNGVLVSCDDMGRTHLFVHKNSTLLGCAWAPDTTAKERVELMVHLREWHAVTIEPIVGRALDAQLYAAEDVLAWEGF